MTTSIIVYTRPDDGVSVVIPTPALLMEFLRYGNATGTLSWTGPVQTSPDDVLVWAEAEVRALAFLQSKDVPGGALFNAARRQALRGEGKSDTDISAILVAEAARNVSVGTTADCPATRRFRNCWRRVGAGLPTVDMPLARIQRMNEVRTTRSLQLQQSDVDLLRSQETSDLTMQTKLKEYRQKLRDLPATEQPNVEACLTPAQLEAWAPLWPANPAP